MKKRAWQYLTPATLSRLPPVSPEIFPQRCSRERENDNKIAIETFYQRRLYKKKYTLFKTLQVVREICPNASTGSS